MVFDDNFPGDIVVNEVRVPKVGEAIHTYYEVLGWRVAVLDTQMLRPAEKTYYLRLSCHDILDRQSTAVVQRLPD